MMSLEELKKKTETKGARISVSAEVYGRFNQKSAFQAKVIVKSEEQKARIRTRLSQAFMFSALDDKEQEIVINAMEEKHFQYISFRFTIFSFGSFFQYKQQIHKWPKGFEILRHIETTS